jgi:hypothetical protein
VKTRKKTEKPFDCVADKRHAQSRIYRKIKGKTAEQEVAYFDQATESGPFAQMWAKLIAGRRRANGSGRLGSSVRRTA